MQLLAIELEDVEVVPEQTLKPVCGYYESERRKEIY